MTYKQGGTGGYRRIESQVRSVEVGKTQFGHQRNAVLVARFVEIISVIRVVFIIGVVHHRACPKPFREAIVVIERKERGGTECVDGSGGRDDTVMKQVRIVPVFHTTHYFTDAKRVTDLEADFVAAVHPDFCAPMRLSLHNLALFVETLDVGHLEIEMVVTVGGFDTSSCECGKLPTILFLA